MVSVHFFYAESSATVILLDCIQSTNGFYACGATSAEKMGSSELTYLPRSLDLHLNSFSPELPNTKFTELDKFLADTYYEKRCARELGA